MRLPARKVLVLLSACGVAGVPLRAAAPGAAPATPLFNDVHVHLTNYVQEGPTREPSCA